jgi:hypothetical protein
MNQVVPDATGKCESCISTGEHSWWCGRDVDGAWKDGR